MDVLIVVGLLLLAGLLRFPRLGQPAEIVFDETYYAKDACLYMGRGQSFCGTNQPTEQSYVHPPLGKWLVATGIRAFGYRPFGWRFAAAVAGTILPALTFLLARLLLGDRWVAGAAGFLAATDFLLIVQSRIAMLDIFLALFVVLGFVFLALDFRRVLALREAGARGRRGAEWRFAAGASFGLALSVKWSAALALAGAGLLAVSWSVALAWHRRRNPPPEGQARARPGLPGELGLTVLALGVVPVAVYLLAYSVWFLQHRFDVAAFIDLQRRMLDYHLSLKATHTYQSKAWTWPLVYRPIAYYWRGEPKAHHVLAFGNPATWWPSIGAAVWLAGRSLRRWRGERVVGVAWVVQYLPWLVVARPLFFFYMTPVVPFMAVGLAGMLGSFRRLGGVARGLVWAYLVLGVGAMLWFFYPVLTGLALPTNLWQSRMWFRTWI